MQKQRRPSASLSSSEHLGTRLLPIRMSTQLNWLIWHLSKVKVFFFFELSSYSAAIKDMCHFLNNNLQLLTACCFSFVVVYKRICTHTLYMCTFFTAAFGLQYYVCVQNHTEIISDLENLTKCGPACIEGIVHPC